MTNEKRYKVTVFLSDGNTQDFEATASQIVDFKSKYKDFIVNGKNAQYILGTKEINYLVPLSSIMYVAVHGGTETVGIGFKSE